MSFKKVVLAAAFVTAFAGAAQAKDAPTCKAHIEAIKARLADLKDPEAGKKALADAEGHEAKGDFEACVEALKSVAEELKI